MTQENGMALLETEKAYIAGLIDGEGCIYIDKYMDKRVGTYSYCLRMKIGMTCLKTLSWVRDVVSRFYKCNLHVQKGNKFLNPKWKQSYVFAFSTRDLCRFCGDILPYMITKKERCQLAIAYAKTHFNNRRCGRTGGFLSMPEEVRSLKDEIYLKIKFLNQNGEN